MMCRWVRAHVKEGSMEDRVRDGDSEGGGELQQHK
jgi:hypothetical protein